MSATQILKATAIAVGCTLLPVKAFAFDWSNCSKEIKKSCPKAKSDKDIFDCLEKVEKQLSKTCYDAHEKYESESGKKDADEPQEGK